MTITPQTISNILYRDCKATGIAEIYSVLPQDNSDKISSGEVKAERIVIHVKSQTPGTYWNKSFNEINILVPRIADLPDQIRLEELEHLADELFGDVVGQYEGMTYKYSIASLGSLTDDALRCEFVNVKILFEVLNVKR